MAEGQALLLIDWFTLAIVVIVVALATLTCTILGKYCLEKLSSKRLCRDERHCHHCLHDPEDVTYHRNSAFTRYRDQSRFQQPPHRPGFGHRGHSHGHGHQDGELRNARSADEITKGGNSSGTFQRLGIRGSNSARHDNLMLLPFAKQLEDKNLSPIQQTPPPPPPLNQGVLSNRRETGVARRLAMGSAGSFNHGTDSRRDADFTSSAAKNTFIVTPSPATTIPRIDEERLDTGEDDEEDVFIRGSRNSSNMVKLLEQRSGNSLGDQLHHNRRLSTPAHALLRPMPPPLPLLQRSATTLSGGQRTTLRMSRNETKFRGQEDEEVRTPLLSKGPPLCGTPGNTVPNLVDIQRRSGQFYRVQQPVLSADEDNELRESSSEEMSMLRRESETTVLAAPLRTLSHCARCGHLHKCVEDHDTTGNVRRSARSVRQVKRVSQGRRQSMKSTNSMEDSNSNKEKRRSGGYINLSLSHLPEEKAPFTQTD